MGSSCVSSICSQDVTFEQIDMKIPKKNVQTLEKFGAGAIARRKAQKMKLDSIKEVADLKKPIYPEDGKQDIVFTEECLIPPDELERFMNSETGGKSLVWINNFQPISDMVSLNGTGNTSQSMSQKMYKGQWRAVGISSMVAEDQNKVNRKSDINKGSDTSVWEGIGIIQFADGSTYQGMTKTQQFNGKGRMTHANGDIYQGEWVDGKANGMGVFVDTNGSMYEGMWQDDQQHGYGTESWNYNKIKFTGEFVEGKKTGKGRFEFEGGYYEGDFVDGQFHGFGKYYFADTGRLYEGQFKNNNMEGKGKMTWPDQSIYDGEFKAGKMEGRGTKVWASGNRFVGNWKNDVQHGTGVFYNFKDQTKRQGEWRLGKRYSWINQPQPTHVTGSKTAGLNGLSASKYGAESPNQGSPSTFQRSRQSFKGTDYNQF